MSRKLHLDVLAARSEHGIYAQKNIEVRLYRANFFGELGDVTRQL